MDGSDEERDFEKRLRDFAHEIRTPLNAMIGYTHLMSSEVDGELDADKLKSYNETFRESTVRLLRICERVLDDAVSGQASIKLAPTNMRAAANAVAETFRPLAADKRIKLKVSFADDFPEITTDALIVEQILSNLVSNAIKYTPDGGTITIKGEVDLERRAMVLVIRDTGSGIPMAVLSRLQRGEPVAGFDFHEESGWGRGLTISRELAERLGGELVFAPSDAGGAVVMLRLPTNPPGTG